jgi:hypothetical protein
MRASSRSRNRRGVGPPLDIPLKETAPDSFPVLADLKIDIVHVVRTFRFTGVDAGTCLARAAIGHAVLHACGLPARLIPGRTGDTIRFGSACLTIAAAISTRTTMLALSAMSGSKSDLIYENTVDPADRALGPIEWWVPPPQFIWQRAASLKTAWRSYGEPMIGQSWYGAWSHCRMPDFASFDQVVGDASPLIARLVGELHLRARIADHLSSAAMAASQILQSGGRV